MEHLTGAIALILLVVLVVIGLVVFMLAAMWRIYQKAGKRGWASIVPFYNYAVLLEMTNSPLWWILWMAVPLMNIIFGIIITRRLAKTFGKGVWFTVGMIFLPFIFYPILAFGNSQYVNTLPPAKPMSDLVKWTWIGLAAFAVMEIGMHVLALPEPHAKPLQSLDSDHTYSKDSNYVYVYDNELSGADPDTFKVFGPYSSYAKDDKHVYYNGVVLRDADPDTFHEVDHLYGADSTHVYDGDLLIPGADPSTFEVLDYGYSKDANHVFHGNNSSDEIVEGADPETFSINEGDDYDVYDAYDVHHKYLEGKLVK